MAPKPKKAETKKPSTSYSPKRMSANDERAAGFRGAITQYQINLKKKDKPKIKITGKASTSGGGSKSIKPGAINQSTKAVKSMPAAAKKMTPALKSKIEKALIGSKVARGTLSMVKEAKKLGNLQGPGVAAKRLKEANQSVLDRGKTAARAKNILRKAKKK
jgi:hypothetical protein